MAGRRAPLVHGAAVLRLEGRHPGKDTRWRTPTPPVPHREEIKEGGERKMAVVVLTLGRWCSRGRLDGGRWRGGAVLGDVGVHSGVDVPAPGPAPPQAQTASSPLLVTVVADSVLGASTTLQCAASLLGSTQWRWRRARSLPLAACSLVKMGKPQWGLVAWALGPRPCLTFEARCRRLRGENPKLPWLEPAGRPRRRLLPPRQLRCGGARRGAKGEFPSRGRVRLVGVHAHRPLGVRARWTGKHPSPARGCSAGRPVRPHPRRGKEKKRIGMRLLTRGPWPSVGERKGRGVMGFWAAAVGLPAFVGPQSAADWAGWVELVKDTWPSHEV
jgi:hypothetical protein